MLTKEQERQNRRVMKDQPRLWGDWLAACDAIRDDDADPDGEELAAYIAIFHRLRRAGMVFDETFAAEVYAVQLCMVGEDLDSDFDDADWNIDLEDSDEDASDHNPQADGDGRQLVRKIPDAEVRTAARAFAAESPAFKRAYRQRRSHA